MSGVIILRQGEDLEFCFNREGESLEGWINTIFVKQFPGDTADITRVIPVGVDSKGNPAWVGSLTPSETALLDVGNWLLIGKLTNSSTEEEDQIDTIRFAVVQAWA